MQLVLRQLSPVRDFCRSLFSCISNEPQAKLNHSNDESYKPGAKHIPTNIEICTALDTTVEFLEGAECFKSLLKNNVNSPSQKFLSFIRHAKNDRGFKDKDFTECFEKNYLETYEIVKDYARLSLSSFPMTIAGRIDRNEIYGNKLFQVVCNIGYMREKIREFYAKDQVVYEGIVVGECNDASTKSSSKNETAGKCSINKLINDGLPLAPEYNYLYKQVESELKRGYVVENDVVLSKCVIFRIKRKLGATEACQIFKESFSFKRLDQTDKSPRVTYRLRSVIFSNKGDDSVASWKVKCFADAESISSDMARVLGDNSKDLQYVLYEREN
ncbi:hypothetical protein ENBRE01_2667 [Enteropsectra breve]|nr:hypothetical protein ENBRE01_2612 [Enteropsectra breve]KAI5152225.1 hypothetical protein ENBRE01_2667 [Enteropsectra breve]